MTDENTNHWMSYVFRPPRVVWDKLPPFPARKLNSRHDSGSRVGNRPLTIPEEVVIHVEQLPSSGVPMGITQRVLVKGPLGTLSVVVPSGLACSVSSYGDFVEACPPLLAGVVLERCLRGIEKVRPLPQIALGAHGKKKSSFVSTSHGTMGALMESMIQGVSQGFCKKLLLKGVGYRARMGGRGLELSVGYSHSICIYPPADLDVSLESPTVIVIRGLRKDRVGDFAASVRSMRPPEPYKGKGISYEGEIIRRKAGKSGKPGR